MACFRPLKAYRAATCNPSGKRGLIFRPQGAYTDLPMVTVPCGQCIGCRMDRARDWAIRCYHESTLHADNCFLTLTYDEQHVFRKINPDTGEIVNSLNPDDFTKFMKRLRIKYPEITIRYFQCGEYGERFGRPHHHVLLFGFKFPDLEPVEQNNGIQYYYSDILQKLWPFGIVRVGDLTYESAAYTARYVLKKVNGEHSKKDHIREHHEEHYAGRIPEYVTMSLKPGIGRGWIDKFIDEVYVHDGVNINRKNLAKVPKYYDKRFDFLFPEDYVKIKNKRKRRALIREATASRPSDQCRERALHLRVARLRRKMEGE